MEDWVDVATDEVLEAGRPDELELLELLTRLSEDAEWVDDVEEDEDAETDGSVEGLVVGSFGSVVLEGEEEIDVLEIGVPEADGQAFDKSEVDVPDVDVLTVGIPELDATNVDPVDVDAVEVNTLEGITLEVEITEIDAPNAGAVEVEVKEVEVVLSADVDWLPVKVLVALEADNVA